MRWWMKSVVRWFGGWSCPLEKTFGGWVLPAAVSRFNMSTLASFSLWPGEWNPCLLVRSQHFSQAIFWAAIAIQNRGERAWEKWWLWRMMPPLLFGQSTFTNCLIWVRILITLKLIVWFTFILSGGATRPGSRGALSRRNIGSHDFNFSGCRKENYPWEIKKICNKIKFHADKFALPIWCNVINISGHTCDSQKLRILSVVRQNI